MNKATELCKQAPFLVRTFPAISRKRLTRRATNKNGWLARDIQLFDSVRINVLDTFRNEPGVIVTLVRISTGWIYIDTRSHIESLEYETMA